MIQKGVFITFEGPEGLERQQSSKSYINVWKNKVEGHSYARTGGIRIAGKSVK